MIYKSDKKFASDMELDREMVSKVTIDTLFTEPM